MFPKSISRVVGIPVPCLRRVLARTSQPAKQAPA